MSLSLRWQKRSARRILNWSISTEGDVSIERILPALKRLKGNVLEIGAGAGNLLKYLPKDIRYTCIEPNVYLHDAIRSEAARCGVNDFSIVSGKAEYMSFPAESFDAVVSVRSLCSVDTHVVFPHIKRVLKAGGIFIFVEHVAAPKGSYLWFFQKLIRYPHMVFRGGCDPAKDIESMIRQAGFSKVDIEYFEVDRDIGKYRIAGVAIK